MYVLYLIYYISFLLIDSADLKQTRRRLSVMSDNKLVEGLDNVNLNGSEEEVVEVCF